MGLPRLPPGELILSTVAYTRAVRSVPSETKPGAVSLLINMMTNLHLHSRTTQTTFSTPKSFTRQCVESFQS